MMATATKNKVTLIDKFMIFLATNPMGTALKVGIGASLGWVINNVSSLNLNPADQAVVIMLTNVAINALNPHDARYGDTNVQQ